VDISSNENVLLKYISKGLDTYCEYFTSNNLPIPNQISKQDIDEINKYLYDKRSNDPSSYMCVRPVYDPGKLTKDIGLYIKSVAKTFKKNVHELIYGEKFKELYSNKYKVNNYRNFCNRYGINFNTIRNTTKLTLPPLRVLLRICEDYHVRLKHLLFSDSAYLYSDSVGLHTHYVLYYQLKPIVIYQSYKDYVYKTISTDEKDKKFVNSNIDIRSILEHVYSHKTDIERLFIVYRNKSYLHLFDLTHGYSYTEFIMNLIYKIKCKLKAPNNDVRHENLCRILLVLDYYAKIHNTNVIDILANDNIQEIDIVPILSSIKYMKDLYVFHTEENLLDIYKLYKNTVYNTNSDNKDEYTYKTVCLNNDISDIQYKTSAGLSKELISIVKNYRRKYKK